MGTIVESLLGACANKLKDTITNEAILILGVEEELTEMLQRVELIRCCIYDAEKKRTKELAANNWLGKLRDVIYDVDEILDVARCKGSKLLPEHHPSPSSSKSAACKALSVSSCFCNIGSRHDVDLLGTEVNAVPKGIGKLKLLTYLRDYPVGDGSNNSAVQDGLKLEDLSSLSQMRYLLLSKLERAAYCSTNTVLMDKKHLKELRLAWSERGDGLYYSEEDVNNIEKVFELLVPPCNLENLFVSGFLGRRYPTWFGATSLSSVIHLLLRGLRSCVDLPPVGQLPNLKYLRIDGTYAVTKVGPEFVGWMKGDHICNELVAFPKLEWLVITDMPNWDEWSFSEEEGEMGVVGAAEIRKEDAQSARLPLLPRLVLLRLEGCPKLRALPRQLGKETTSLKELRLIGTDNLKAVEDLPLLSELLNIQKCEGLQRISNLPQVTELRVHGCPNLSHVEGLVSLQQLGLGEDMQEISSRWVPRLQNQHQRLHGEDLDIYNLSTS